MFDVYDVAAAFSKVDTDLAFRFRLIAMQPRPLQIILASVVIISSAVLAFAITPREMMTRSSDLFDLKRIVPKQFGDWRVVPSVRLIEPEPGSLSRQLYSQELGRGYRDHDGNLVMLLIAYGPDQSARLQLHRPELCYAAAGFRVLPTFSSSVVYRKDLPPLPVRRLLAKRESRREPITYWTRIGENITGNVIDRQLARLRLLAHGRIADGVLIRVSTIGLASEKAYSLQDHFIRELLAAIAPENLSFFVGGSQSLLFSRTRTSDTTRRTQN